MLNNLDPNKMHPNYNRTFVDKAIQQTLQFLQTTLKGENKAINFKLPSQLRKTIDFQIRNEPSGQVQLLRACQLILDNQAKPYHPHFHNQLFGGFDQYSYIGAVMTASLNGVIFTYETAPCFTLMENDLYEHMRKFIGWQTIDGTMCPGGSFANFMGIHMSRAKLHPDFNTKGLYGYKPMKIFTSEVSHYSIQKGVNFCGIGTDNIVHIKTDSNSRMIPAELEKAIVDQIKKGNNALLVNSTVGTTVEGSIDPVEQIGQICAKYNVWHHIDAAYGGAIFLSPPLMHKLGSLKNADSITFDPHKGLVVPQQATLFLCRHEGLMDECNSVQADYLFHKQRASYDGSLDVGKKTLQCGRALDIFKLWTYLKGNGWDKIAKQIENRHTLALHVRDYIISHQRYQLVIQEVDTFGVCFFYIPQQMHRKDFATEDDFYSLVSKVIVLSKKFMIEEGKMLVGYSKSKIPYYFWRIVMSNPFNTIYGIDQQMELIAKYCEIAYKQLTK